MSLASRAPLELEIYLRALTGYVVGQNLLEGFGKVAVITQPDRVCSALSAALISSYIARTGYRESPARVFVYEEGREAELAAAIREFGPDAVYVAFGGESKMSRVREDFARVLEALADAGVKASLVVHVRAWLATRQLSTVLANPKLRAYLESLSEIRVFTADLKSRKFYFHKVRIENGSPVLEKTGEAEITEEHARLLSASLPPPE